MHSQLAHWFKERATIRAGRSSWFMNYIEAHEPHLAAEGVAALYLARRLETVEVHKSNSANAGFDAGRGRVLSSKDVAELESLYDDEVAYVDGKIGEVLTFLKSNGLDENTLVVITSDHGEHFGEHGLMSHQYSVYEPLVRVPLLVRFPRRFSAGREERMVQSHDVYPTILELAGIGWKPLPGRTCQSLLQPASGVRFGISEYLEPMMGAVQKACV